MIVNSNDIISSATNQINTYNWGFLLPAIRPSSLASAKSTGCSLTITLLIALVVLAMLCKLVLLLLQLAMVLCCCNDCGLDFWVDMVSDGE